MRKGETWEAVTELAESQWGLVTTAQAQRVGVGPVAMNRLAGRGYLERVAYGVYRVRGAAPTLATPLQAAWLQLDPARLIEERWRQRSVGAVVSHRSAARAQELGDVLGEVHEFTVAQRRRSRRCDVVLHRGRLDQSDVRLVDGLPVTTPWRTVCDLVADGEDGGHVAGILADAARGGLLRVEELDGTLLDRHAHRWGAASGRQLLDHLLELGGVAPAASSRAEPARTAI